VDPESGSIILLRVDPGSGSGWKWNEF